MDGLIIVDKPRGPSSFDVVRRVRQVAGTRRVGHTGTLDPDASGILGVAIGRCTKLSQFLTLDRKRYDFDVVFGTRTDSDDAMGSPVETKSFEHVTKDAIETALQGFIGEIEQVPPVFSAVHVDGKRAYELARKGVEFELEARLVTIYGLGLDEFDTASGVATMWVECGSGTYVRSIARDLASSLDTVAHARRIHRTAVGPFRLEQAVPFDKLDKDSFRKHLLTPAQMVANLPGVRLEPTRCDALGFGQRIVVGFEEFDRDLSDNPISTHVAVHDTSGDLVAVTIVENCTEDDVLLKPKRVLQPRTGPGTSQQT
jgi:tRNA pseudouridine55 synthase